MPPDARALCLQVYSTIMASLDDFEHAKIEEWGADVERSSQAKLRLPLLVRAREANVGSTPLPSPSGGAADGAGAATAASTPSGAGAGAGAGASSGSGDNRDIEGALLAVNFDPALVRLLREVKYFLLLGLEVPAAALEVFKKAEVFRRQTGNLDLLVNQYNAMMMEMLPVEAPLLKSQLVRIDATLVRGLRDLNWRSPAIDGFIGEAQTAVRGAFDMLVSLKGNLREVVGEMEAWSREPLLARKSKPMSPEEFESTYKVSRQPLLCTWTWTHLGCRCEVSS